MGESRETKDKAESAAQGRTGIGYFSFHDRDIFTIRFIGRADWLLSCLEQFEESVESPYFGANGELFDE